MGRPGLRNLPPRVVYADGRLLTVRVRESRRARHVRIVAGPDHPLEVVVPRGLSPDAVAEFLVQKRRWIEDTLAWVRAKAERPPALGLDRRGVVWLQGRTIPVEQAGGARSMARLANGSNGSNGSGGSLVVAGPRSGAAGAVERWYRREARATIEARVAEEAGRLKVHPVRVTIRDARTRWGSCSTKGSLSFAWRLLLAPPDILDHVVAHELCHLRAWGHGQAFRRALAAARPAWRDEAGWLREFGDELQGYRPEWAVRPPRRAGPAG